MRALLSLVPRRQAVLAVALGTAAILCGTALLAVSGALITAAAGRPESLLVLLPMITSVRLFAVARAALRYAERVVSHDLTLTLVGRLRAGLLERLVPLAPAALSGVRGGELLARIRADVDELQGVFVRLIAPTTVAVLSGGVAVLLTAWLSPALALALAALLLMLGVAVPLAARRAGQDAQRVTAEQEAAFGADLLDLARGLADQSAADGGRTALATLQGHLDAQQEAERVSARVTALTAVARDGAPALGVVAALGLVGAQVAAGRSDPILLAAAALGVLGAFEAVGGLGQAWTAERRLRGAAQRVQALSRQAPAVADPVRPRPLPAGTQLRLDDVWLSYPEAARPALAGFDLTVSPGQLVALVGPSGRGKSSLLALALRSRDPDRGRVLLGGVDVRELALAELRSRFAWTAQDPQLLGGTLAGNLRLARPSATEENLRSVLTDVGLEGVLDGVGLHGWIGESGDRLSAGERARVGVARTLLSPAPVLLLDEPTAHLDVASARSIVDLLGRQQRSVVLVTHSPELLGPGWRVVEINAGADPSAGAVSGQWPPLVPAK